MLIRVAPLLGGANRKDSPLTLSSQPAAETVKVSRPRRVTLKKVADPAPPPTDDKLAKALMSSLEDAKAEDIVRIDVIGKTTIADMMIIATGRSNTHVGSIADKVSRACIEAGFKAPKIEGQPLNDWVLLDAGDAIIHIFRPEVRQFYNLEKMWSADRPGEARAS